MTGNRDPGSASPSISDIGEHGNPNTHRRSRRTDSAPPGIGVKTKPAARVDLRSSLDSVGGVDFSSAPRSSIDAPTFTKKFPALPVTVQQSRFSPIDGVKDEGHTWLGAGTTPVPPA